MRGFWDFNPRPKMFAKKTRIYDIAMRTCSSTSTALLTVTGKNRGLGVQDALPFLTVGFRLFVVSMGGEHVAWHMPC
jgi:hypothetical protein